MFDYLIKGGSVVDGTGAPARRADIAIADGRIAAVGNFEGGARRTIDADGLTVAPGFIDIHSHYDAQVSWDPNLSPSPLHGVTTVVGGNCGFTVAPLVANEADYILRMLARVEGMPVAALQSGMKWDWESYGSWLDQMEGRLGPNAGFMVGHSTLRRVVMGESSNLPASEDQIRTMEGLLRTSLACGGIGFSSSRASSHLDGNGDPVPSRHATHEEFLRLAAVTGMYPGTQLELIPSNERFTAEDVELMTAMSRAANRPLNWNVLRGEGGAERALHQLEASDSAAAHGGRIIALVYPDASRLRRDAIGGLQLIPGWRRFLELPVTERLGAIADPAVKDRLRSGFDSVVPGTFAYRASRLDEFRLQVTGSPENASLVGSTVADIAAQRGVHAVDAFLDIVAADGFTSEFEWIAGDDDSTWKLRADLWNDPRTLIGASDSGAHMDVMCGATYTTRLIGPLVRDRGLLTLEDAVHLVTQAPASVYGLIDRGTVTEGAFADLVVFDPSTVGPGPLVTRRDLPGNARRVYAEASGVERVFVNGIELVIGGSFTDARPGKLLRSGADTYTVTATAA